MAKRKRSRLPAGISQLKDGRYRIRVAPLDPKTGKQIDRQMTLAADMTLAEAVAERDRFFAEVAGELEAASRAPTVTDYAERWLVRKQARGLRQTTLEMYVHCLDKSLAALGENDLDGPLRAELLAWRREIEALVASDEYSIRTVTGWWRTTVQMIRDGCADYGLPDPTARLDGPVGTHKPRRQLETLTPDETRRLVEVALDSRSGYRVLIPLLAFTGMRRGEGIGLRWEDVQLDERLIFIRQSASWVRGNWAVDRPKNGQPRRVGVPDKLAEILSEWRKEMVREQHPGLVRRHPKLAHPHFW